VAQKAKTTIAAALGRQERDSTDAGAETPKEKQEQVSTNLHEKAYRERERWAGGE
jgi:hypothetical protein